MSVFNTLLINRLSIGDGRTPVPFQPGGALQLEVLQASSELQLPEKIAIRINKVFSIAMSPVMDVSIMTNRIAGLRAVLKLYDRRFGTSLRKNRGEHSPHSPADEEAFLSFLREGKMEPFLVELEHDKQTELIPPSAWHYLDGTPDGQAKFEAVLWDRCRKYCSCETEVYSQLSDLQGKLIPRMYGQVRLVSYGTDSTRQHCSTNSRYLEVKGVLLELIRGYNLWDIDTSPRAPSDIIQWPCIIQNAVDAVREINERGVILEDCDPRNVMVDMELQEPRIIDLAQCDFKDKMIECWKSEEGEPGGSQADRDAYWDLEYWKEMRCRGNPFSIGLLMRKKLGKSKGLIAQYKYPRYTQIIGDS